MNRFPPELLIYAAIFIGIMLFNYVVQRLSAWQKQQEELPPPELRPSEQRRSEAVHRTRRASALRSVPPMPDVRAARLETPIAKTGAARRGAAARSFLTGRESLRRAVITMTVLGPCRAQEPYERR